jgi:hypothetical protein
MNRGALVLAYHGCDATVRDDLITGALATLKPSENRYDWLGPGIYFYEGDCQRARQFAQASHDHPHRCYTKKPIGTPAVVGAVLRVVTCLDMTTQNGLLHYRAAYETLLAALTGRALPQNEPAGDFDTDVILHHLDEAVIRTVHAMRANEGLDAFQVVRGAFYQGQEAAPSSAFRLGTHIQLAVRDAACVVAWFLPPGEKAMSRTERAAAMDRLSAAHRLRQAQKPRHRA